MIGACRASLNRRGCAHPPGPLIWGTAAAFQGWSSLGGTWAPVRCQSGRRGDMGGGGPRAALLEVVDDRGGGGPVKPLTAGMPPGEHGLGEPEFGGLFGAFGVVRVPGR